jgi:hypothetical protein
MVGFGKVPQGHAAVAAGAGQQPPVRIKPDSHHVAAMSEQRGDLDGLRAWLSCWCLDRLISQAGAGSVALRLACRTCCHRGSLGLDALFAKIVLGGALHGEDSWRHEQS